MRDAKNQEELTLRYLKRYRTITPLEALQYLGIFRLAARIYLLRADYRIETKYVTDPKTKKHYAKYIYKGPLR